MKSAREMIADALEKAGQNSMATVYRSKPREGTPDYIETEAVLAGAELYATQRAQQVREECCTAVRENCPACEGSGHAFDNTEDDQRECMYCGVPATAIRSLQKPTDQENGE